MSFLEKISSSVENHIPLSTLIISMEYRTPSILPLSDKTTFRGRTIAFGSGVVEAFEAISFLVLNIFTKIAVGVTDGRYNDLNRLSRVFGNQVMERGSSSISLLFGSITNPTRAFERNLAAYS